VSALVNYGDFSMKKKMPPKPAMKKGKTITDKLNSAYEEMKKKNGPC
jgi:hypothetical protein